MHLKRTCRNTMIAGTLLIWIIKFLIRPVFQPTGVTGFLLGVAPNLFGSFLIPFGAVLFFQGKQYFLATVFRMECRQDLRFVSLLGFGLVLINEFLQLYPLFGRTFDPYDLLFSAAGTGLAWLCFSRLLEPSIASSPKPLVRKKLPISFAASAVNK